VTRLASFNQPLFHKRVKVIMRISKTQTSDLLLSYAGISSNSYSSSVFLSKPEVVIE
jgi:hypothetical protein